MAEMISKVVGVTFKNDDGSDRQEILSRMTKRRKIRLRDAASSEYPEAISVHNVKGEQLGFLPAATANYIRVEGIDIESISADVDYVGSRKGAPLGCSIRLKHPYIRQNAISQSKIEHKENIDWVDVRNTLGVYSRKLTREDVDRYFSIKNGQKKASVSSTPQSEVLPEKKKHTGLIIAWVILIVIILVIVIR